MAAMCRRWCHPCRRRSGRPTSTRGSGPARGTVCGSFESSSKGKTEPGDRCGNGRTGKRQSMSSGSHLIEIGRRRYTSSEGSSPGWFPLPGGPRWTGTAGRSINRTRRRSGFRELGGSPKPYPTFGNRSCRILLFLEVPVPRGRPRVEGMHQIEQPRRGGRTGWRCRCHRDGGKSRGGSGAGWSASRGGVTDRHRHERRSGRLGSSRHTAPERTGGRTRSASYF